jgi:hypothetical protein
VTEEKEEKGTENLLSLFPLNFCHTEKCEERNEEKKAECFPFSVKLSFILKM